MKNRSIFIVFITVVLTFSQLDAQQCELELKIVDEFDQPISYAIIAKDNKTIAVTDLLGAALIKLNCSDSLWLLVKHINYFPQRFYAVADSKKLKIVVKSKSYELKTAEIQGRKTLDTIVGENPYYVKDYIFIGDSLLTLLRKRQSQQCILRLSDETGKIFMEKSIKGKPEYLFKDPMQTVFIVFENKAEAIDISINGFTFYPQDYSTFQYIEKHVNDVSHSKILTNNNIKVKPWFDYMLSDRKTQMSDTMTSVKNEILYEQYHSEFKFLSARDRHDLRVMEYETGVSKYDLAAYYTNFASQIWYKPAKAPYFKYADKHYVFNFCKDTLHVFDVNGQLIESQYMNFVKEKEFKEDILHDPISGEFYALFMKNGNLLLGKIKAGMVNEETQKIKLKMRYAQNIKVNNGKVWYLSRPYESYQSTYLYSEDLDE